MRSNQVIYILLLATTLTGCLVESDLNQPYVSSKPIILDDGLLLSTPTSENMNEGVLNEIYGKVYKDENFWSLRSLLVFRNGKLVSEAYLKSNLDITDKHLIWSCTKQVVGILTGIAQDRGLIMDIDDPISNYFDTELEKYQDKSDITIRNLLTMKSGIAYNNGGVGGETDQMLRQIPNNSIEFILERPLNWKQGTKFHYNDGNPHLLSALIQKKVGKPTDVWADEVFFSKIGMTNYNWIRYKDGITIGGFGIETTPRELAKIALCVSNNGIYNNQRVVSSSWIKEMVSTQTEIYESEYSFGFLWWVDSARGIHFMWGHGGQFAFIVPSKNLVIVMTSIPNTQGEYQIDAKEALQLVEKIMTACY